VARRRFGSIRKLPSGRYQARYRDPAGQSHAATCETKADAGRFLAEACTELARGTWIDPRLGHTTLRDYAEPWLEVRDVRPRTRELYAGQLRNHILPTLGDVELSSLSPAAVRRWHGKLLAAGHLSSVTVAKCYRLLRTILGTAADDGLIAKNPCILKGAGAEHSPARRVVSVKHVEALANAMPERYRMLVLLALFRACRWGELIELTRSDLNFLHLTLRVERQCIQLDDSTLQLGPPKSDAGRREVSIPPHLSAELTRHLDAWVGPEPDALLFCTPSGTRLRRGNFTKLWRAAVDEVGPRGLHFHDLRHSGATLAAATGATTKELMARIGHASPRAALNYQHAVWDRDQTIAQKMSDLAMRDSQEVQVSVVSLRPR
jgi:integrase